jgi:hypothetical protein
VSLSLCQDTFLSDVREALEEHKTLELGRMKAVRESLIELSHLQSAICDEEKEAYHTLNSRVENLKVDDEVAALLWSVDRLVINDMNLKDPSLMNESEKNVQIVSADFSSAERARNSSVIFHKVQQTLEVLDFLRNLVNSVGVSLRAVAEAKRVYAKSVYKCFEKHGLSSSSSGTRPAPGSLSHPFHQNRAGRSNSTADSLKRLQSQLQSATGLDSSVGGIFAELIPDVFSDVLYRTESPTSVAVWVATVSAFGGISASHSQTAEKYFELFLPTLSSIQRRVFAMKNDLMSKQISSMKLIDSTQATVLKLSQKIEKVKYLIKTQHEKVEKSKEEVLGGHGLSTTSNRPTHTTGSSSPTNVTGEGDEDAEATSPSRVVSGCPSNDDEGAGSAKEDLKKEKEGDRRGKASKIMLQGLDQFGSRLQKARMTVVAGLASENHEERLERREGRMVALESEERELLTAFYSATANMDSIEESVRMDIDSCLKAAKEVICHDISSFVDILQQLSTSQRECVACFEGPVKAFQSLCDSDDTATETLDFVASVHSAFRNSDICCKDEDKNIPSETPTVTYFTPLYNKTIEDEKASIGIFSDLSKYDLSRYNSEHEGERDRLSPVNDYSDLRIVDHEEDVELSDDRHSSVFSVASASGSEVEHEVASLERSNGHHLQRSIHDQLLEQQSLVEIALNKSSQLETVSDHFQPISSESATILTFEEHSVTEVQSVSSEMTETQRSFSTTTTTTKTQTQTQVDPQGVVNDLLAEAACQSRMPSERDVSSSGSRDGNSASPALSLPLDSFHSPSRDGERVHFRESSSAEGERVTGRDDSMSVDVKRTDVSESLIAVSEMLRQKVLHDELATDRSFEGSAASGSSVNSACMSPAALPPRPPRPPKVKRSVEKEKPDKDKEKDTEKEEKERIGQYMIDMSSVPDKSVSTSSSLVVNKIDTTRLTADGRAPVLSKSEDNLLSSLNQSVMRQEKRDGAATSTDEVRAVDSLGGESSSVAEDDKDKSSKDVLSSKEFLDSPQVMRLKERPIPTMSAEGTPMTVNNATVGVNKKVPQIMGNKPEDSSELVKFGLSPSVRVLETFSCALYPKKGLLTHGRYSVQHAAVSRRLDSLTVIFLT